MEELEQKVKDLEEEVKKLKDYDKQLKTNEDKATIDFRCKGFYESIKDDIMKIFDFSSLDMKHPYLSVRMIIRITDIKPKKRKKRRK